AALALPQDARVPGGVAIIPIADGDQAPPTAYFNDKRVLVIKDGAWKAVVGIPLDAAPGPQQLVLGERHIDFEVRPKAYPVERLTVKRQYVEPDPEQLARIRAEQPRIRTALTS